MKFSGKGVIKHYMQKYVYFLDTVIPKRFMNNRYSMGTPSNIEIVHQRPPFCVDIKRVDLIFVK